MVPLANPPHNTSPIEPGSEEMKKMLSFKPTPAPKEATILTLLHKIPFLAGLLDSADDVGLSASGLAEIQGHAAEAVGKGFQVAGVALAAINFIRIPAIYLAATIIGEKPPITLTNNAEWIYSSVLLGLTISALTIPGAAPIIVLTAASLGLGVSVLTMARTLYNRYQFSKELKQVEQDIASETKELNELHSKTLELEKALLTAEQTGSTAEQLSPLRNELDATTQQFKSLFQEKNQTLQTLYDKKFDLEQKVKKNNTTAVMDKGIGIVISTIAVAGFALSLFFPPLGIALITGAAISGLAYLIGRTTFPTIKNWVSNLFAPKNTKTPVNPLHEQAELAPSNQLQSELSNTLDVSLKNPQKLDGQLNEPPEVTLLVSEPMPPIHESTTTTMQLLFGEKGADVALHQQIADYQSINAIQRRLSAIVVQNDTMGALTFLNEISTHIQTADSTIATEDIKQFFSNFEELTQITALLKRAISQVKTGALILQQEDKNNLMASQSLMEFLGEQGIDLHALTLQKGEEKSNDRPTPTLKSDPEEP
jgi:hypothetical protein